MPHVLKTKPEAHDPLETFSDLEAHRVKLTKFTDVPRIQNFPFLIVGTTFLKHVRIAGYTEVRSSINLSSRHADLFPTVVQQGYSVLNIPEIELPKDLTLCYFRYLNDVCLFVKNYQGLLFVEANVAELFQDPLTNHYSRTLAFAYIKLLSGITNLPKHVIILGCAPRLENNFKWDNGVGIANFNAHVKYLAYQHGWGFVDPAEIFLSHRRIRTFDGAANMYGSKVVSPPVFPRGCFTRQGELTQDGFIRLNNYMDYVAEKAREIGTKLGLPFRHDVMDS